MLRRPLSVFMISIGLFFTTTPSIAANSNKLDSFEIVYSYAEPQCTEDIKKLIQSGQFRLSFKSDKYNALLLTGSPTEGVTVESPKTLANEGLKDNKHAYMLTEDSILTISDTNSYRLSQLWVKGAPKKTSGPWSSAFYLGDNKECLVANHRMRPSK